MPDSTHPIFPWLTAERRAWLYRLVLAIAPLAVLYGVASEAVVFQWIGALAAFLGVTTAAIHTPK